MQVQMRGKLVGIEPIGKSKNSATFLEMPEDKNSVGIIKLKGSEADADLEVGQKVYFGTKRTSITIEGKEIFVMESDNVVALVKE